LQQGIDIRINVRLVNTATVLNSREETSLFPTIIIV